MTQSDEEPVFKAFLRDLSKLNKGMKKNLKEYGMEDLYGLFLAVTFMIALTFGVLTSFFMSAEGMNFAVITFFFTLLGGAGAFLLVGYVLIPLYHEAYTEKTILKTLLSYQILDLLIGIVLAIILWSKFPIGGSGLIFFALAFVHPISKNLYGAEKTIEDLKSTLNKIYVILIILQGIITLILKFAHLF